MQVGFTSLPHTSESYSYVFSVASLFAASLPRKRHYCALLLLFIFLRIRGESLPCRSESSLFFAGRNLLVMLRLFILRLIIFAFVFISVSQRVSACEQWLLSSSSVISSQRVSSLQV